MNRFTRCSYPGCEALAVYACSHCDAVMCGDPAHVSAHKPLPIELMADYDDPAPADGEQLAGLVYSADAGAWVYDAAYSDPKLAQRRAVSLSESFGVPFRVISNSVDGSHAVVDVEYTDTIRRAVYDRDKRFGD